MGFNLDAILLWWDTGTKLDIGTTKMVKTWEELSSWVESLETGIGHSFHKIGHLFDQLVHQDVDDDDLHHDSGFRIGKVHNDVIPSSVRHLESEASRPGRLFGLTTVENGMSNMALETGTLMFGMGCVVHGPKVTKDIVEKVLVLLMARHPLLRCVLKELEPAKKSLLGGEIQRKLVLEEVKADAISVEIVHTSSISIETLWDEVGKKPIQLNRCAPLPRILVADNGQQTALILVFNHAFSDGMSCSSLAIEFLQQMGDLFGDVSGDVFRRKCKELKSLPWGKTYETAVDETFHSMRFGKLKQLALFTKLLFGVVERGKSFVDFPIQDRSITPENIRFKGTCEVVGFGLTKTDTERLLRVAKENGVTIGALTGAVTLEACRLVMKHYQCTEGSPKEHVSATVVCNTRMMYHNPIPNEELGYHVSVINPFNHPKNIADEPLTSADLWALCRTFKKHMRREVLGGSPLGFTSFLSLFWQSKTTDFDRFNTITLSNAGIFPFESTYGPWKTTAFNGFQNYNQFRMPTVTMATCNGSLLYSISATTPAVSRESLVLLCETMYDLFLKLSKNNAKL